MNLHQVKKLIRDKSQIQFDNINRKRKSESIDNNFTNSTKLNNVKNPKTKNLHATKKLIRSQPKKMEQNTSNNAIYRLSQKINQVNKKFDTQPTVTVTSKTR